MGRAAARKATPVVKVNFPRMAREDYPDKDYEGKGRACQSKLADSKGTSKGKGKKLTGYEEYLLTKHFPAQEKKFLAAQRKAGARRKEVRRAAIESAGLLLVEGEEDNDANEANNRVFKRRSPSKVLLKTKDLCNGYF